MTISSPSASPIRPLVRERIPFLQIGLALLAMLAFCLSDVLAKMLAPDIPALQVAWFRYIGGMVALLPVVLRCRSALRSNAPLTQGLRSLCMLVATVLLISAVQVMPMAEATTLVFVSPIFITLLSVHLLGERVGRVRLACVAAGLAGVAMVARPGFENMNEAVLLPIFSALCWALAMALTRVTQTRGDSFLTTLLYAAVGGFLVLCLVLPAIFVMPTTKQALLAAIMSLCWTGAQVAVLAAYRIGRVADVAPFSYTQIVWSVVFGYLIFADIPDTLTLAGCAVVAASGVVAARQAGRYWGQQITSTRSGNYCCRRDDANPYAGRPHGPGSHRQ